MVPLSGKVRWLSGKTSPPDPTQSSIWNNLGKYRKKHMGYREKWFRYYDWLTSSPFFNLPFKKNHLL
ncbi:hypothetical protein ACFO4N_02475 [Camelliibacillus cellulosilyticus]|uniref:Uncharacterized protein n=1 Tax=Camelliibacillus cellulosilyticus TaxID=2174486 RepID=A0ABV9GH40_9BACL